MKIFRAAAAAFFAAFLLQSCFPQIFPSDTTAESLTLNEKQKVLMPGETFQLEADVRPAGNWTVEWTSKDERIVTVDENGLVTAVAEGNADVVATVSDVVSDYCGFIVGDGVWKEPLTDVVISEETSGIKVGESIELTLQPVPAEALLNYVIWESSDQSVATVLGNGKVTAVGVGTAVISATAGEFTVSCTVTVSAADPVEPDPVEPDPLEPDPSDTETESYVAVDLGLSVKWGACNVGAKSVSESGDQFAWGETQTKGMGDYSNMGKTYKYYSGGLTKYNGTDNLKVLAAEDDAAAVRCGEGWSTPTKEQWIELMENCTWSKMNVDGRDGVLVRSKKNGKFIFLPAAGRFQNGMQAGDYCQYMTATLATTSLYDCFLLNINPRLPFSVGNTGGRFYGYPVRPVCTGAATSAAMDKDAFDLVRGSSEKRSASGLSGTPVWHSSDASVATVAQDGTVTGVDLGDAIIWATSADGTGYAAALVTVAPASQMTDLGLGLKWASWNVGADNPGESGVYVAWAETGSKEDYTWYTYNYKSQVLNNRPYFTKYSGANYTHSGDVDDKTVLEAVDDAASVQWGNGWRTPTRDDFSALLNGCTAKMVCYHQHHGCRLTGPGGNSIFIPYCGYKTGTSWEPIPQSETFGVKYEKSQEAYGYYWTATRGDEQNVSSAVNCQLQFFGQGSSDFRKDVINNSRQLGLSVRAVHE